MQNLQRWPPDGLCVGARFVGLWSAVKTWGSLEIIIIIIIVLAFVIARELQSNAIEILPENVFTGLRNLRYLWVRSSLVRVDNAIKCPSCPLIGLFHPLCLSVFIFMFRSVQSLNSRPVCYYHTWISISSPFSFERYLSSNAIKSECSRESFCRSEKTRISVSIM